jgi:prevent-host-death family protein
MDSVSFVEFRRDAKAIIRKVRQGKRLILTYRGKPVMRLVPIRPRTADATNPLYRIATLAVSEAAALTNEEIDQIVYGAISAMS